MKTILSVSMIITLASGFYLLAAEVKKPAAKDAAPQKIQLTMTPEMRENAAKMHEEMTLCLRSDKPMEQCHKEMKESCSKVMGEEGCPMMQGMGMKNHKGKSKKNKMRNRAMGTGMGMMEGDSSATN